TEEDARRRDGDTPRAESEGGRPRRQTGRCDAGGGPGEGACRSRAGDGRDVHARAHLGSGGCRAAHRGRHQVRRRNRACRGGVQAVDRSGGNGRLPGEDPGGVGDLRLREGQVAVHVGDVGHGERGGCRLGAELPHRVLRGERRGEQGLLPTHCVAAGYTPGVDPLRRGGGRRGVRLEGPGGRDQGSRQGLGGACELTLRVGRGSLRRRGALEAVPVDVPGRARLQGADPQTLLKLAYGDQRLDRLGQGHLVDGPASGGRDGNGGQGADNGNDRAEVSNSLDHFRQARGDVADRRGERTAERGEQRLEGVGEILEFRRRGLVDALGLLV